MPLIVLTADRPPELRGIGAGQTIDQLKLYGSAVRWFCEVGTHEADDDGLLHYRSTACRAFAAAGGDPRPGPVHLNLAWREPLAPIQVAGAVTATSTLALEGRGESPLTAVATPQPAPPTDLLEELGAEIAATECGLIVCGRQTDPRLAPLIAELAAASGYPILAEPTSQLRLGPHDRSLVVSTYDSIARSRPDALEPELVIRFGEMPTSKALRQWLLESGVRQVDRRSDLRLERALAPRRGDRPRRPGAGRDRAQLEARITAPGRLADRLGRRRPRRRPGDQR